MTLSLCVRVQVRRGPEEAGPDQDGGGCPGGGGHPQSVTVSLCVCRYDVVLKRMDLTKMAVDVLVEAVTPVCDCLCACAGMAWSSNDWT